MDTSQIIWIIVAIVVVLIIIGIIARIAGRKKAERNRQEAGRIRAEAQETQLEARERESAAQRASADAEAAELASQERKAEAERLQAESKEAEVEAERKRSESDKLGAAAAESQRDYDERLAKADKLDPDTRGKRRTEGAGREDGGEPVGAGGAASTGRRADGSEAQGGDRPDARDGRAAGNRESVDADRDRQEHPAAARDAGADPRAEDRRVDERQRGAGAGAEPRADEPVAERRADGRARHTAAEPTSDRGVENSERAASAGTTTAAGAGAGGATAVNRGSAAQAQPRGTDQRAAGEPVAERHVAEQDGTAGNRDAVVDDGTGERHADGPGHRGGVDASAEPGVGHEADGRDRSSGSGNAAAAGAGATAVNSSQDASPANRRGPEDANPGAPAEDHHRGGVNEPVARGRQVDRAPGADDRGWQGADEQYDRPDTSRRADGQERRAPAGETGEDRGAWQGNDPGQQAETAGDPVGEHHADAYGGRARQGSAEPTGYEQDVENRRRQEAPPASGDPLAMDSPDAYGEAAGQRTRRSDGTAEGIDPEDVDPQGRHGDVPKHRDQG